MKIQCKCGHIIVDQTDFLPYKGHILPDAELESFESVPAEIVDFMEAIRSDRRSEWIKNKFSDSYPTDLDDEAIIFDIIQSGLITRHVFECEACGRILIEDNRNKDKTIGYQSFYPEEKDRKGLLDRVR